MSIPNLRPSPIAGLWYEGNPKALAASIDSYLDLARLPKLDGKVVAIMAPHAGHHYSGPVAGYAFASIRGQTPDLVAIVSPMHHPYREPILVTAHEAYSTPLGSIPVDRSLVGRLDAILSHDLGFGISPVLQDPEHSLEIMLPFLQQALAGEFKLLPIMLREQTPLVAEKLGHALAQVLQDQNCLLVASTDLSHFYNENEACAYDEEMLRQVESFSPQGIFQAEDNNTGFACGFGALASVLWAAKDLGADTVKVLRHATSGTVTGDFDRVVGYGAAVALKTQ
ncbi:MAG: AmmeMemoRadiSam system protein B [Chloroflexi bacterium GWB2_49_20]|nr:MAG: AmmeMemoRadiSam system protein B [Chloroflexi bacterium GWB2_49_20]OGN80551.1 MAG: AmmeMemoRadiSam system protein B [Chloroflexi bacterium GWC2_49_37]OGN83386.1 MAG: AmmeMemoRadiSam system protein B [Chloroflexi bacterium GWD2_49_16]HCC78121.1 AmmeMemoRadiSam system protein B [Anaerolineae bacterium]